MTASEDEIGNSIYDAVQALARNDTGRFIKDTAALRKITDRVAAHLVDRASGVARPMTSPPGFRDGIEAAANWHETRAQDLRRATPFDAEDHAWQEYDASHHEAYAKEIRAIPTPDILPTGWNSDMGGLLIELRDAEAAVQKGIDLNLRSNVYLAVLARRAAAYAALVAALGDLPPPPPGE